MARSRLINEYLKHQTKRKKIVPYILSKERNCVSFVRKTKINYYENLDEKDITDNKKFWKTVKPLKFISMKMEN